MLKHIYKACNGHAKIFRSGILNGQIIMSCHITHLCTLSQELKYMKGTFINIFLKTEGLSESIENILALFPKECRVFFNAAMIHGPTQGRPYTIKSENLIAITAIQKNILIRPNL